MRRDARAVGVGDRGRLGRRRRLRRVAASSSRSPLPWPGRSPSTPPSTTPRTASRCSAASGSPGSTTPTSTSGAPWRPGSCSAAATAWRLRLAEAALDGRRRATHIDLEGAGEQTRQAVREEVGRIAALTGAARRTALADAGLLAPHYPPPYGRGAGAVDQIVIDEELRAAGHPDARARHRAPGRCRRSSSTATTRSASGSSARACAARSPGASCSASPAPGSDLAALRTRAERVDGGWRLTGQKVWTSLAREADWAICLARTEPGRAAAPGHHLLPRRHAVRRDRDPAAARADRGRGVQRGVPRRRRRAGRLRGRGGRRRLEARPHHAGQRAGGDGRQVAGGQRRARARGGRRGQGARRGGPAAARTGRRRGDHGEGARAAVDAARGRPASVLGRSRR